MVTADKLGAPKLVNKIFGARVRSVRATRKMTQANLAEALGLSRVTIANLESGEQNVQLHQVFSIAEALETPVERLLPAKAELDRERSDWDRVRSDRLESSDHLFLSLARNQLFSSDK